MHVSVNPLCTPLNCFFTFAYTAEQRKRVSVGEKEKKFVVQCYNRCDGKEWNKVLMFAKRRLMEGGLPDHVLHMYLEYPDEHLTRSANEKNNVKRTTNTTTFNLNSFYCVNGHKRNACDDCQ